MTPIHFVPTDAAPTRPARMVDDFASNMIIRGRHELCAGCGEPAAMRAVVEMIEELELTQRAIAVFGIGCYTAFSASMNVEVLQSMHGRAPSLATGVKRARSNSIVFTIQGDGDMVNEGLQEVLHTAARGESVTCVLLNNGVFGETGGQMTSTTALGQRTKNTLEGRTAKTHGFPIAIANLIALLEGSVYVARGATNTVGNVWKTRQMLRKAFELQSRGAGFTFVEILTMCPTGWFVETGEAPAYLEDKMAAVNKLGVIKDVSSSEPAA